MCVDVRTFQIFISIEGGMASVIPVFKVKSKNQPSNGMLATRQ